jgi:hypothetical protein
VLLDTVEDTASSSGGRRVDPDALRKQVIDLDSAQELHKNRSEKYIIYLEDQIRMLRREKT